ncbi:bifunctional ABT1-ESF2 [Babesia duncani]|uniref:Bifunctional ABT1-ESF2 n=1 Tax=Babesia duncani TaxID=323732 RepID=A0AAD9PLX2_9APIC|nr:bifunctional ABT1-ESF2 [Babesia duncani]
MTSQTHTNAEIDFQDLNESLENDESTCLETSDSQGIIFISRIPPYMNLSKLKNYFGKFGEIGRVYAAPESITDYKNRVKLGGNAKLKFKHAWIQYLDKKIAKRVAKTLNGHPVADGRKNGFYYGDLWNLKYLPKYKWCDLVAYFSQYKRNRTKKLHQVLEECRKRNFEYIEQMHAEKQHEHIAKKRGKLPKLLTPKTNGGVNSKDNVPTQLLEAILK